MNRIENNRYKDCDEYCSYPWEIFEEAAEVCGSQQGQFGGISQPAPVRYYCDNVRDIAAAAAKRAYLQGLQQKRKKCTGRAATPSSMDAGREHIHAVVVLTLSPAFSRKERGPRKPI